MKTLPIAALLALLPATQALAGCEHDARTVVAADEITVALQAPGRTEILVEFDAGTATLTRNGELQVQELAALLRDEADLKLTLEISARSEAGAALMAEREKVLSRQLGRLDVPARRYEVRSHGPSELAEAGHKRGGS